MLSFRGGGGKLTPTSFKLSDDVSIINIIQVEFSCSLSDCSVCLVAGVGGKLSRPVYLDPHPLSIKVKLFC